MPLNQTELGGFALPFSPGGGGRVAVFKFLLLGEAFVEIGGGGLVDGG